MPTYSIIIPAFNKAQLTRNCLRSLERTIDRAAGETIVVDNGSTDDTPRMLTEFPWVRVLRNERNRGFAAANNQAAAQARGEFLVLLNNDTQALDGWLDALLAATGDGVGAAGAKLLFPDGTLQHAGIVAVPSAFGPAAFVPMHHRYLEPDDGARDPQDFNAVTGACLLTPRALYMELGGLDEGYWNGGEDVDYCYRVRERGLRVVYEPRAALLHFESRSGVARFLGTAANTMRLAERWNGRIPADHNEHAMASGTLRRPVRSSRGTSAWETVALPEIAPFHAERESDPVNALREAMEIRGDRYLAAITDERELQDGWQRRLLARIETDPRIGGACEPGVTLFALRRFPAHLRLGAFAHVREAIDDFKARALREAGVVFTPVENDAADLETALCARRSRERGLVSIVTLSWNAPQFTKLALESIRAHTSPPYEVIVVDNGSGPETTDWLRTLDDVRVIYNRENRGFAGGNNQGFAAARGEYVVMLNNDVVVTHGWLDGLLEPFERIRGLGITAPRSNRVAGHQQLADCNYANIEEMHRYANDRRERLRGGGYVTDRAIGLCLCIDRRVIGEIGGIDPRFAIGNFEDDDFCMRVRGAGYKIYVCDDVFIHHFGSQTFAANKVDWSATMAENWKIFARKWGYDPEVAVSGYDPRVALNKPFDRRAHIIPLDDPDERRVVFLARVACEADWSAAASAVRRYARAFSADDSVLLALAATGDLPAQALGERVEKALAKEGIDPQRAPDVEISDENDLDAWRTRLPPGAQHWLDEIEDASPSGLRRFASRAQAIA